MKVIVPWVLIGVLIAAALIRDRGLSTHEHQQRATIDSLTRQYLRIDTVRRTDSVRVVRVTHALDTLRVTVLERLTDTVAVKEYIYQTDTLRTACLACVASAARLSRVNDSLRTAYIGLTNLLTAQKPSKFQKALPYATGLAGFLLGAKLRP